MKYLIYIFATDMGIYRLIILILLGAFTLQVKAQEEFIPVDGEPRIKVVFYKKAQKGILSRRLHHRDHHARTSGISPTEV